MIFGKKILIVGNLKEIQAQVISSLHLCNYLTVIDSCDKYLSYIQKNYHGVKTINLSGQERSAIQDSINRNDVIIFSHTRYVGFDLSKIEIACAIGDENCLGNRVNVIRFGEIFGSAYSIFPKIKDALDHNLTLNLVDPQASKFLLTKEKALQVILRTISLNFGGSVVVPYIKAYSMKDLFELYHECFGLKYSMPTDYKKARHSECLIRDGDISDYRYDIGTNLFISHGLGVVSSLKKRGYYSEDYLVSKDQLKAILVKYNFFLN